jgi:signal transduction histidine kinase
MQISFSYDKRQVIQGLRFHFLNRPEIRILIILVNVFAIFSAAMFYFRKVSPFAFLISSVLWMGLMITFWFILPTVVYRRASTFEDAFTMFFTDAGIRLQNERGATEWKWANFSSYYESGHFIHLYFDSRSFFLVPKQPAEQQGNLAAIRELLKLKIRKK